MKKLKTIMVILLIVLITGCSYHDSPDKVAKEMAKRLSEGNYENIAELITENEKAYIDEKAFKEYLDDQKISIEGNKTIKVIEDKINLDTIDEKKVEIEIDNGYILNVNTKKVNDKWYVDIDDKIKEDYKLIVSPNAKITINGKELSAEYKIASNESTEITCGTECKNLSKYKMTYNADVYEIPEILTGTYKIKVEDEVSTFEDQINIYGTKSEEDTIIMEPTDKYKEKVTKYLKESIETVYASVGEEINYDSFKKYYHEDIWEKVKENYSKLDFVDKYSTFTIVYKDLKLSDLQIDSIYNFGDSTIVNGKYTYSYVKEQTYTKYLSGTNTYNRAKSYNFTIELKRDSKGNLIITGGTNTLIFIRSL